ncbi:hypothetical protein ONE63_005129 [Megalurothrips usitatus]|uniref:DDE Tnp4 domain-containing protein n=1 Tax=Megalurothrips usitatus TaxID=439358 RepID=A0AAV7XUF0_9NEOP|nr:hypothetical protein ONE63_005129 [Megalurothrips usitatus]
MDRRRKVVLGLALIASDQYLNVLGDDSDGDSDEDLNNALVCMQATLRLRGESEKPVRNEEFFELTIPRYSDSQFRQHFRLTRTTYQNLEHMLGPALDGHEILTGRPRIEVRKQLMSVLWLLATPDSYRSVADRFDMGKSILHDSFQRVILALVGEAHTIIRWPTGPTLQRVKARFSRIGVLPNVIGAIDGSYIQIPRPKVDGQFYNTRKNFYAVTLQAVCDADLFFTDCFAGHPGSVPDVRVFRNSDLWATVQNNLLQYFPEDEYIIGDKAYPVLSWCIPPFINRGILTEKQKRFNTALSSMRQVIERAFALLKGRFRRLKYLDMQRIDIIPQTILACCVLHNVCLLGMDEDNDDFLREGLENNQAVDVNNDPVPIQEVPFHPAGAAKRNHLVNIVAQHHARNMGQ